MNTNQTHYIYFYKLYNNIEEEIKRRTSKINFNAPLAHSIPTQSVLKTNKRENCLFENIDGNFIKHNEEFFKKLSLNKELLKTQASLKREQFGTQELKLSLDKPVTMNYYF